MKHLLSILLYLFFASALYAQDSLLLWKFQTGAGIYSSPVVNSNRIYFGSSDRHLYAVDKTSGRQIWKFETKGPVNSSPAIHQNSVIFSSTDGNIYAVDKNTGKLLWKFKTKGEQRYDLWDYYLSSPAIHNNVVYIGSGDSTVYALRTDSGKPLWSYKTNGVVHATPVLKDHMVFTGSYDGNLYALDSRSGKLIWKFKTVGDANFPKGEIQRAALVHDNTVFFGSRDYNIYALDSKTGTGKWNMKERGSWVIATPLLYNNHIYFGTSDTHRFYCMSAEAGELKWTLPLNMRVYGTASLIDNQVVLGCFNGKIYLVDAATGKSKVIFQTEESKKRYHTLYGSNDEFRKDFELYGNNYVDAEKQILSLGSILSDPLVENQVVYFGDTNGFFYALKVNMASLRQ